MTWLDQLLALIRKRPPAPTPTPPPVEPQPSTTQDDLRNLVREINLARMQHAVDWLPAMTELMQAAQMQSEWNAKRDKLGHDGPPGLLQHTDRLRHFGVKAQADEVVASGWPRGPFPAYTCRDAVKGWLGSKAGHRAALLDPSWTHVGAGWVLAANGRPYATGVFVR